MNRENRELDLDDFSDDDEGDIDSYGTSRVIKNTSSRRTKNADFSGESHKKRRPQTNGYERRG